jgi:short-subunit dehydrogenase
VTGATDGIGKAYVKQVKLKLKKKLNSYEKS